MRFFYYIFHVPKSNLVGLQRRMSVFRTASADHFAAPRLKSTLFFYDYASDYVKWRFIREHVYHKTALLHTHTAYTTATLLLLFLFFVRSYSALFHFHLQILPSAPNILFYVSTTFHNPKTLQSRNNLSIGTGTSNT